ncbi:MAG: hypothetical protein H6523_13225 [Mycolicibacterium sp.]|nr:hypothetical protein [Mycolicibacterium sp.]
MPISRHSAQIDDALWEAAQAAAKSRHTHIATVITEALRRYVAETELEQMSNVRSRSGSRSTPPRD